MFRLNYEKKDLGLSYLTAVTITLLASLVLGFIFGAEATGWKFWLMQAMYTLLIGGSAFIYAAVTKTKVFAATKLNVAPRYAHVLWGVLAVIFLIACMTPINTALLDGIEALGLKRPSVGLENNVAGLLVVACLLPAICEEVVFRGTVAMSLESSNKIVALLVSGALFSLFHAQPAQTVHQFVLGAFLTLLVFRSGSLWTSVIVHLFNNTLVVVLSYTPIGADEFWSFTNNTAVVVTCLCVGVVGFVACVFGYVKTTKSVWNTCNVTQQETRNMSDNGEISTPSTAKNNASQSVVSLIALTVAVVICVALWITNLLMK